MEKIIIRPDLKGYRYYRKDDRYVRVAEPKPSPKDPWCNDGAEEPDWGDYND
jgi:hypothetical protein